ncbi:MAG TPA: MmcQ/YjbR family DNA-binding protein [Solirubrobacterales bacterium]|nr:MmcQ/YjbR family DNA-binding protein [Solirubrobacterales bacterium]
MAEWDDVRRIALALPETSERPAYGNAAWRVRDKIFVWERPLRPKEVRDLGESAPSGPIVAVRVADLGVKEALLQDDPETFFTTPHFDGYAAVLIRLDRISAEELDELIVEAWLCRAPKRLAKEYLESRIDGGQTV